MLTGKDGRVGAGPRYVKEARVYRKVIFNEKTNHA